MKTRTVIAALLLILPGVLLGVSGYTFYYAKGYSYLLNDPKACVNCHVMREHFTAWEISPHRFVTCNECHVPQNTVGKYATKIEHGMRHSYAFTFENPQVIRLKTSGAAVVEDNCIRCHSGLVAGIWHGDAARGGMRCFECHRGVGHAQ